MVIFSFREYGENLGTRPLGKRVREQLLPLIEQNSCVVLDFTGVNVVSNCSRTRLPNGRVPKFSPYSLKLNVTIIPPIRYQLGMCHYIDQLHLCGLRQPPQGQFLYLYAIADTLSCPAKSRSR